MTFTPTEISATNPAQVKVSHDALDELFAVLATLSRTLTGLNHEVLGLVRHDINRFKEMTEGLHHQKTWQGRSALSLTTLSASLAILGSLLPAAGTAGHHSRLKDIIDQVGGSEFLRTTAKTTAEFFHGVVPVSDVWFQGRSTTQEAARSLTQQVFQEEQRVADAYISTAKEIQQMASSILQASARG